MKDGEAIHDPSGAQLSGFDENAFYMATHAKTRKMRNLRKNKEATLHQSILVDWIRHVGTMMTGTVDVVEQRSEFGVSRAHDRDQM